ncbi:lysylphosphatidylglycerol synthase transmembrane domain-containing protein [Halomicroarcula sp. GCM10025709]|uniref:lysylphosphatidylglycerol synthase transmembrane domain-containing protein n=1 Tax=Haloarcula TaxID=2237 RepID=UPI0024C29668|nr:lysylphosphatidylglycerol synthase transmembrane domain-containing protein [Halomicroarcula sp. YJ-61-S]
MATTRHRPPLGRRQLAGTALALALIGLLLLGLDTAAVATAIAGSDPTLVAGTVVTALAAQLVWSLTTVTLLTAADSGLPPYRVQLGYLSGTFGKQILPLGTVSGTAIMAYVIAEDLDRQFRDVFAPVAASELLIFGSSLGVAVLGLVGLVADPRAGVGGPMVLALAAGVTLVLVVGVALVAYRRAVLGRAVVGVAGAVHGLVAPVSERLARHTHPDSVAPHVDSFLAGFGAATGDERRIAVGASLAVLGWLTLSLALYSGLAAVGVTVPFALALFLAPASGLATLLPTPGGLGGSEVGLTAVLTLLTGAGAEQAAAGVLLYRLATYWLVLSIGGLATAYLSASIWRVLE